MKGFKKVKKQLADERIDTAVKMKIAGRKASEIAATIGVGIDQVYNLLKTDVAQLKLHKTKQAMIEVAEEVCRRASDDVAKSIEERLQQAASSALTVMSNLLDSENEFVQVKAASDLMDRDTRMSKTKNVKMQGGVIHALVTAEQLALAARTARELATFGTTINALPISSEMITGVEVMNDEPAALDT